MSSLDAPVRLLFSSDFRSAQEDVQAGVIPSRATVADNHWDLWHQFCTSLHVHPYIPFLSSKSLPFGTIEALLPPMATPFDLVQWRLIYATLDKRSRAWGPWIRGSPSKAPLTSASATNWLATPNEIGRPIASSPFRLTSFVM